MATKEYKEFEKAGKPSFDEAWQILRNRIAIDDTIPNTIGSNKILKIDNRGVKRITSKNNINNIPIEHFRSVYNELIREGSIVRKELTKQIQKRCSSGVVWILRKLPFVEIVTKPYITLSLK
ncbi:MAG: hypothetical protein NC114_09260 [Ruminococcus flavefaciens]|nr:hypothetical protein [Ruminococcus flavefaciens]